MRGRTLELAVASIEKLMEANFRTVHVQLEQLAKLAPDVEDLKRDIADLRAHFEARTERLKMVEDTMQNLDTDFIRRDEALREFVRKVDLDHGRTWKHNTVTVVVAILALLVSAVGIAVPLV